MNTRIVDKDRLTIVTRPTLVAFAAALLSVAACAGKEPAEEAGAAAARDPDAPLAIVDQGLSTPESVLWDGAHNVWYVTNINGSPSAKDDNGYVVRLGPDGQKLDSVAFLNGADDDITLHAPKGMALVGDTLWVADIDAVRGFDVVSGMPVASVDLTPMKATFLNDIAKGTDGALYITDTGISFDAAGNASHTGQSRVFSLTGRTAAEAVVLPKGSGANGISWDSTRGEFLIVSFSTPSIFAWKPGTRTVSVAGTGPGGADGIVVLADGRAVYSSWTDSSLTVFTDGASSTLRKGLPSPADIGYDHVRGIIAVPLFASDRVELWPVAAEAPRQP